MKLNCICASVACFVIMTLVSTVDVYGQPSKDELLDQAESHLRSIYEQRQFGVKRFRAEWLADSTGYTVTEDINGSRVSVRYDAATGNRTAPDTNQVPRRSDRTSPDGKCEIYSENGNYFVRNLETDKRVRLTNDLPDGAVSNSQAVWSPDGKWIAFVQTDATNVRQRSILIPDDPSYPGVKEIQFARVGGAISKLKVGVVDSKGIQTRWISYPIPSEGYYLGQVSWAGNSNELFIEKLSRFRDKRQFLIADISTGAVRTIFEESDRAWVVASYGKNSGITWFDDYKKFIVLTEKDGWRHAYVYSRDGRELKLLTPGKFDIIQRAVVDEAKGWYYFYASPDNATQKYLYRLRLNGNARPERVTPQDQPGTHDYDFSPDAGWAFHTYSSFDKPPVTELVSLPDHKAVRVLEGNKELCDKMKPLISHPTKFFQLKIDNGVEMDGWMIKPKDFDPSKKYPLFIYVYGEPHGQTVLDNWASSQAHYHRVVADLGYIVVSMDNRGTPAPKGAAWRRSIFGSLGPLSTEEQAAGVKELARTRKYVDKTRVAIWGWSGGGSNTLNALFRKPDVYDVGIAVVPKPQPHLYNAWFQEIYMETRETNPDGYRKSAPINFAEGLKGDLLIVHGTGETNTHLQIVEGLVDRLIELGKPFDYMAYPNRNHGIREGKGTELHHRMLMVRYLLDHLPHGAK